MKIARTHPGNAWFADSFHEYVRRTLAESNAEPTEDNVRNVYVQTLMYAMPAGNA